MSREFFVIDETKYWYLNGLLHREDGPAVERANGGKCWYLNGKRHREDGPAIEFSNGDKEWYLDGELLTEEQFNSRLKNIEIVCLCGSTRFYDEFMETNYRLTMEGKIVLSVGFFHHRAENVHGEGVGCTKEQKIMLDELHKRKIDMSNSIFVINKNGYIGESTQSEIEYAINHGKIVRYMEPK